MRYIWIIMLAIVYLIWSVYSVKDIIYCCKRFSHPIEHFEEYTDFWILLTIGVIFCLSLKDWLVTILGE